MLKKFPRVNTETRLIKKFSVRHSAQKLIFIIVYACFPSLVCLSPFDLYICLLCSIFLHLFFYYYFLVQQSTSMTGCVRWLVGRLVCRHVGNTFVRQSTRRTILTYLALFTRPSVYVFVTLFFYKNVIFGQAFYIYCM